MTGTLGTQDTWLEHWAHTTHDWNIGHTRHMTGILGTHDIWLEHWAHTTLNWNIGHTRHMTKTKLAQAHNTIEKTKKSNTDPTCYLQEDNVLMLWGLTPSTFDHCIVCSFALCGLPVGYHQPLATTLYVFPRFTVSIYPFSIFRLFSNSSSSRGYLNLWHLTCLYS